MPRRARVAPGGLAYHVLNRAVARLPLFEKDGDYAAFERVLVEANERHPTRVLAYCVMPNHWHFVLWPREDGELTAFVRWLTLTHTQRWHAHHGTAGTGHLYQGSFKSFPIQRDGHLLNVIRYVERNALRAGLAERAEAWRWGSLWHRTQPADGGGGAAVRRLLHAWPVDEPADYLRWANQPQTDAELASLRQSVARGRPYGADAWQRRTAARLGLQSAFRPPHRPRKASKATASADAATKATDERNCTGD